MPYFVAPPRSEGDQDQQEEKDKIDDAEVEEGNDEEGVMETGEKEESPPTSDHDASREVQPHYSCVSDRSSMSYMLFSTGGFCCTFVTVALFAISLCGDS